MVVTPAPSGDEIGDIAGLLVAVVGASAIVDRDAAGHLGAQALGGRHLGFGDVRLARIGQNHDVEVCAQLVGGEVLGHVGEALEDGGGILVVDGHDEDVAPERAGESTGRRPAPRRGKSPEADHRARRGKGDPGESHREQRREHHLQPGRTGRAHHGDDLAGAEAGERHSEAEDEDPGAQCRRGRGSVRGKRRVPARF